MINFIKFRNTFKNTHKSPRFNLGGGARFPKKLAQNLFATTVCIAMVLCTMPRGWGGYEAHADDPLPEVTLTANFTKYPPTIEGAETLDRYAGQDVRLRVNLHGVDDGMLVYFTADYHNLELTHDITRGADRLVPSYVPSLGLRALVRLRDGTLREAHRAPRLGAVNIVDEYGDVAIESGGGPIRDSLTVRFYCHGPDYVMIGGNEYGVHRVRTAEGKHFDEVSIPAAALEALWETQLMTLHYSDKTVGLCVSSAFFTSEVGSYTRTADYPIIEERIDVSGQNIRIQVFDPYGVLPRRTQLSASAVDANSDESDFFVKYMDPTEVGVERQQFFTLSLKADGQELNLLAAPVLVRLEKLRGWDAPDINVLRISTWNDQKYETTHVQDDYGTHWIQVEIDHLSPYVLLDALTEEDLAENHRNTIITVTVVGIGLVLILALGVFLHRLKKKKLEN